MDWSVNLNIWLTPLSFGLPDGNDLLNMVNGDPGAPEV